MKTAFKRLIGYSVLFVLFCIFVVIPTLSIMGVTVTLIDKMVIKFVDARDNPPPLLR